MFGLATGCAMQALCNPNSVAATVLEDDDESQVPLAGGRHSKPAHEEIFALDQDARWKLMKHLARIFVKICTVVFTHHAKRKCGIENEKEEEVSFEVNDEDDF